MKNFLITSAIPVCLFLSANGIIAQNNQSNLKQVCLDNTEQFSIASKYVEGETYFIQVGLPIGYSPDKKSYPVLYVLDGDKSFGMTKEIADWLMLNNHEIKDIIVVAITYGRGTDIWWDKRARDYTHSNDTIMGVFKSTGGADKFLKFVKNELFTEVNKKYKTNQDSTAIMGISFGGMLSTYILFNYPEMFKGYIIIAPTLIWNGRSILKNENEYYKNHKDLNKMIYIAYGSLDYKEFVIEPTNEFINTLHERNYTNLKFVHEVLEGETHISLYPTALTHGLKAIFK